MRLNGRELELLAEGIDRFNRGRFWDAHESWETIWLESREPVRTFLQGLIQLAAAYHHFQRGTLTGGIRLTQAAHEKLSGYPARYLGVDRERAVAASTNAQQWAEQRVGGNDEYMLSPEDFPRLELEHEDASGPDQFPKGNF